MTTLNIGIFTCFFSDDKQSKLGLWAKACWFIVRVDWNMKGNNQYTEYTVLYLYVSETTPELYNMEYQNDLAYSKWVSKITV